MRVFKYHLLNQCKKRPFSKIFHYPTNIIIYKIHDAKFKAKLTFNHTLTGMTEKEYMIL